MNTITIYNSMAGGNKMYKLKFYNKTGANKGNLNHEEFFQTLEELQNRYNDVFVYNDYSLNPTAWKQTSNGWERIAGY